MIIKSSEKQKTASAAKFVAEAVFFYVAFVSFLFGTFCAPGLQLREEIVAFVVNKYESREILYSDFPNSLHAYFRKLYAFNALDTVLRQNGCNAADSAKIKTAVLFAGIRNLFAPLYIDYHNH